VRRSPTWGRPSTLIGDCGSTPQRETKTAITCAPWRWFECSPRLKLFQRSTNMFRSMSNTFTLNTSPIVMEIVGGRALGEFLVPSWRHIGDTQRSSVAIVSRRGANCV